MEGLPEWLKWVGGGFISLISLFLGSRVIEVMIGRRYTKEDAANALHDSNAAAKIGAESAAFNHVMTRVTTLESRVDSLQDNLANEMAKSARLEERNNTLTEELERQRESNHKLRNRIQDKDLEIVAMKGEISQMQSQIHALQDEIKRLSALEAKTHGG